MGTAVALSTVSPKLIVEMQQTVALAGQAQGRNICVFVGNTGSGKSTTINYLAGLTLRRYPHGIDVVPPQKALAKIGHRGSETKLTTIYETGSYCFGDTGGFLDTRVEVEVVVPLSARCTLQNAKGIKVILCADANLLFLDKAVHLTALFKTVMERLVTTDFDIRLKHSFLLLFTKEARIFTSDLDREGNPIQRLAQVPDLIQSLSDVRRCQTEGSLEQKIYNFVLREEGRYIFAISPVDQGQSKREILRRLDEMSFIESPSTCFDGIPYSPTTRLQIKTTMEQIGAEGIRLYDEYMLQNQKAQEFTLELEKISKKIGGLRKSLEFQVKKFQACEAELQVLKGKEIALKGSLKDPESTDLAAVKLGKGKIAEDAQKNKQEKQVSISKHEKKIETIISDKTQAEESLAGLERRAGELHLYWTTDIHRKRVEVRWWQPFSGPLEVIGGRWQPVKVHIAEFIDVRSETFSYAGAPIAQIQMNPPVGSGHWCHLAGGVGHTTYSGQYSSAFWEEGGASIIIQVKHADLPATVTRSNQLKQQIQDFGVKLALEKAEIAQHEAQITRFNSIAELANKDGVRAEELGQEIDALQKEADGIRESKRKAEEKRAALQQEIHLEKPKFQFLDTFLDISKDEKVARSPFVAPLTAEKRNKLIGM